MRYKQIMGYRGTSVTRGTRRVREVRVLEVRLTIRVLGVHEEQWSTFLCTLGVHEVHDSTRGIGYNMRRQKIIYVPMRTSCTCTSCTPNVQRVQEVQQGYAN